MNSVVIMDKIGSPISIRLIIGDVVFGVLFFIGDSIANFLGTPFRFIAGLFGKIPFIGGIIAAPFKFVSSIFNLMVLPFKLGFFICLALTILKLVVWLVSKIKRRNQIKALNEANTSQPAEQSAQTQCAPEMAKQMDSF